MYQNLQLSQEYLSALTSGANLNQFCEITAKYCNLPIALTLSTRTIVAHSADYSERLIEEYENSNILCDSEEIKDNFDKIQKNIFTRKAVVNLFPYTSYKRINIGIFSNTTLVAVIDCPIIKKADIALTLDILEASKDIYLTALQLRGYVSSSMKCPMHMYLSGLLNDNPQQWVQQHNLFYSPLETISRWQIIWCPPLLPEDYFLQIKSGLAHLCSYTRDIWFIDYNQGLAGICNADNQKIKDELFKTVNPKIQLSFSLPFTDLTEARTHLQEAVMALKMADFEGNTEHFVFVQNYKTAMDYLEFKQHRKTDPNSLLSQIRQYDTEHDSNYYQTVKEYLLCSLDYKKTAERMFVHKNTIMYRLQRISELFHIDMNDCRIITSLYLGLYDDFN